MKRAPKKVILNDGAFSAFGKSVYTNIVPETLDCTYLLGLCGFESLEFSETGTPLYSEEESYSLRIEKERVCICANTERGVSNALKLLAVLKEKHGAAIPCIQIEDTPDMAFRAIHFCIFDPNDGTKKEDTSPEKVKERLIRAALSGYNYAFIEFWGMFPYQKHPYACWPYSPYTREVVEDIISLAIDKLHITPLPVQNLTSHAGWSRITSRRHVVLDQRPDLADMWVPSGWCFATENPKTQQFLRDVMDELLEVFRDPPYFHASCDKCFGFGSTEEDRTKPADLLFGLHICRLNSYLQSKGCRMVMWGDMLYSSMDSLTWKASPMLAEQLPKNILINVWTHNDIGNYWADVDFFESLGYQTVYSPFINKKGIESMARLCHEKHSLGIVQTTWYCPETAMEYAEHSANLQWNREKLGNTEREKYEALF